MKRTIEQTRWQTLSTVLAFGLCAAISVLCTSSVAHESESANLRTALTTLYEDEGALGVREWVTQQSEILEKERTPEQQIPVALETLTAIHFLGIRDPNVSYYDYTEELRSIVSLIDSYTTASIRTCDTPSEPKVDILSNSNLQVISTFGDLVSKLCLIRKNSPFDKDVPNIFGRYDRWGDLVGLARDVYTEIKGRTASHNDEPALTELGFHARLKLLEIQFAEGPWDAKTLQALFDDLQQYTEGDTNPDHHHLVRLNECLLFIYLRDCAGCVECVDKWFGAIFEGIDDSSEETLASTAACKAQEHKIWALIRLSEFDRALQTAQRLLELGDKHTFFGTERDGLVDRIELYIDCNRAMYRSGVASTDQEFGDPVLELISELEDIYPRFRLHHKDVLEYKQTKLLYQQIQKQSRKRNSREGGLER